MSDTYFPYQQHLDEDSVLHQLYASLRKHVWTYVENMRVQSWHGQEYDVVEDIVQETVLRVFMYMRQASNDTPAIKSLPAFSKRIARNHCIDLQRKTARLIHPFLSEKAEDTGNVWEHWGSPTEPIEDVLEELALAALLVEVVPMIAAFPPKQRTALLVDLADLTDFDAQPGALELAFEDCGIDLRSYKQSQPITAKTRSQSASLRYTAYKRLRDVVYPHLCSLDLVC